MKKILISALALAITFSVSAQERRELKKEKGEMHQRHGKSHDKAMMKDLNLTDAQKAQMKANMEEYRSQMKALEANDVVSVKEMKEKKRALHEQQKAKMEAILTADQKAQLAQSRAKMESQRAGMESNRMEKMKAELGLSNDQAAKLKSQNEATRAKIKALKDDQTLSQDAKKAQMKTIKEAAKAERKNLLTAEQLKKMEEMKKEGKYKGGKKDWKDSKK